MNRTEADLEFQKAINAGRLTCGCGCLGFKDDRKNPLDSGSWMYMGSGQFKHRTTRRYLHKYEAEAKQLGKAVAAVVADDLKMFGVA